METGAEAPHILLHFSKTAHVNRKYGRAYKSDLPPQGLCLSPTCAAQRTVWLGSRMEEREQERLAEPGDRARERPLNEKVPSATQLP